MPNKPSKVVDGKKPCTKCGQTKPVEEFYKQKGYPAAWCKQCMRERTSIIQKEQRLIARLLRQEDMAYD